MKQLALILILLLPLLVHAHETAEDHEEPPQENNESTQHLRGVEEQIQNQRAYKTDFKVFFPFHHIKTGNWFAAIAVIIAWVVLLRAMYVLALLLIARAS